MVLSGLGGLVSVPGRRRASTAASELIVHLQFCISFILSCIVRGCQPMTGFAGVNEWRRVRLYRFDDDVRASVMALFFFPDALDCYLLPFVPLFSPHLDLS